MSIAASPPAGGATRAGTQTVTSPGEVCPLCGAPLHPEQEWCLSCGAAARTRLAASPSWKGLIVALAVVVALSLGVLAAALVSLAGGSSPSTPATTRTVTTAAAALSPSTSPTVTTTTPATATTPTTAAPTTASTPTASAGRTAAPGTGTPAAPNHATHRKTAQQIKELLSKIESGGGAKPAPSTGAK